MKSQSWVSQWHLCMWKSHRVWILHSACKTLTLCVKIALGVYKSVYKSYSACRSHSCACWNHSCECHICGCQNYSACGNYTLRVAISLYVWKSNSVEITNFIKSMHYYNNLSSNVFLRNLLDILSVFVQRITRKLNKQTMKKLYRKKIQKMSISSLYLNTKHIR
jgi:hypothetical protein